jgi:hypothetical protein
LLALRLGGSGAKQFASGEDGDCREEADAYTDYDGAPGRRKLPCLREWRGLAGNQGRR